MNQIKSSFINEPILYCTIIGLIIIIIIIIVVKKYYFGKKKSSQNLKQNINLKQKKKQQYKTSQSNKTKLAQPSKTLFQKDTKKQNVKEQKLKYYTQNQLHHFYNDMFIGTIGLKPINNMQIITALCFNKNKILLANTKNYLVLYDLSRWKKQVDTPERYYTSLDNSTASAVTMGAKYYYVALNFDKTIAYYSFKGGKGGIYFQQVCRFARNILKSEASSIHVAQNQQYIITSGSQADAVLYIWSMKGQKLSSLNTYQIQHYCINYSINKIIVRGWTSQVKIFNIYEHKDNSFNKIDKNYHLPLHDNPLYSTIDNFALYSLTVSKNQQIVLWNLHKQMSANLVQSSIYAKQLSMEFITNITIYTYKDNNDRYRTLIALSNGYKIILCNTHFKIIFTLEGIDNNRIHLLGTYKQPLLYSISVNDRLQVWNCLQIYSAIQAYTL